jgi:RIO kinase 2
LIYGGWGVPVTDKVSRLIHIGTVPKNPDLSSIRIIADFVKKLGPEDYMILKILASALTHRQSLTKQQIVNYSKLHEDIVDFRLRALRNSNLVSKHDHDFAILRAGLDTMVLKLLADKNVVGGIGKPIGLGKESDVYEAMKDEMKLAVKFYRIGRISFRGTTKKRSFSFRQEDNSHHWLLVSMNGAKKEVEILQRLMKSGVSAPKPLYRAMHCVVMKRINGIALANLLNINDPPALFNEIMRNVRIAYKNNIIHSDLSEYNILIGQSGEPHIIDWPQAVSTNHPNAKLLITRDVVNIVNYFNRKFHLAQTVADGMELVLNS